jgi:hypothetical protein
MNGGNRPTFSFSSTRNQEPFNDFKSIYNDSDEFFDTVRNYPASGRQSVPVGFRASELLSNKNANNEANDTSSGYSTASSVAPSSSTYWTRKADNESEFVPIRGLYLQYKYC